MPTQSITPPADIWVQFAIVAVVVMSILLIGAMYYKLWKDLLAFQEKQEIALAAERATQEAARAAERAEQDVKRDQERDKQRQWEAEQAKKRDEQWQAFLKTMQEQWISNDKRNAAVLERLVSRIDDLAVSINNHDTFVRASNGNVDKPRSRRSN